jgi:hypothetical protein
VAGRIQSQKNLCREPCGALNQEELIGSKPIVLKLL